MAETIPEGGLDRLLHLAQQRQLPEVKAGTSYGTPALEVRGAAFARLADAGVLVLQCPAEHKTLLMEMSPTIYFETSHYVGHDAVLVRLDEITDEELSLRLEDAWRHKAPVSLQKQRPTQGEPAENS